MPTPTSPVEVKVSEWRPTECGTRIGDFILKGNKRFLKVKCRRCTKEKGKDQFHLLEVVRAQ